jgi:hypothetical protein
MHSRRTGARDRAAVVDDRLPFAEQLAVAPRMNADWTRSSGPCLQKQGQLRFPPLASEYGISV